MRIAPKRIPIHGLFAGIIGAALVGAACAGGDASQSDVAPDPQSATTVAAPAVKEPAPSVAAAPSAAPPESARVIDPPADEDELLVRSVEEDSGETLPRPDGTAGDAQNLAPIFTVVLDPGHGGDDPGAATNGIVEADSNLDLARRVEALLKSDGINVVLTRLDDGFSQLFPTDRFAGGEFSEDDSDDPVRFGTGRADLQARIDLANQSAADLFVSIHSNAFSDSDAAGVEVWYDPNHETGAVNEQLAQILLSGVIAELRAYGYAAVERGILDDSCWRISTRNGRCFPLFVLGPARVIERARVEQFIDPAALGFAPGQQELRTRATEMPGALVELLFLSNDADSRVLRDDDGRNAIARGLANAILQFLSLQEVTG